MKKLLLERKPSTETETEGFLSFDKEMFPTIEQNWIPSDVTPAGEPFKSCAPAGRYRLIPHKRPNGDRAYAWINESLGVYYLEQDIPEGIIVARFLILFHKGNYAKHVQGCCSPGLSKGTSQFGPAVWHSSAAMKRIVAFIGGDEAILEVIWIT